MAIGSAKADQVDFSASDTFNKKIACWRPSMRDVDRGIPEKKPTEARIVDLGRNNGYMRGAIASDRETVVGSQFLLQMLPSADVIGPEHCDWIRQVETQFHEWADDPGNWIDARRTQPFVSLLQLASTQLQQHGEYLFTREWRGSPLGVNTCFLAVDPCRLESKRFERDGKIVGGIERDRFGAPLAYHIRKPNTSDIYSPENYQRIPKFNRRGGQQQVFHGFDADRADQTRGFSRLASTVIDLKQIDRYEQTALEQAMLAAAYGLYLKSDYGNEIFKAFADKQGTQALQEMQKSTNAWAAKNEITFDGVKIPKLAANDDIGTIQGNHPNQDYEAFIRTLLRKVAAASGISYEQLTKDYSNTTFSSARASLNEAWRTVTMKRDGPVSRLATHIFRQWMDEQVARGYITIPDGITYWDRRNRSAITRCKWIGPAKGEIDALKAAKANEVYLNSGQKTLREIAAECGQRVEDLIEQRAIEQAKQIDAMERANGITFTPSEKRRILTRADVVDDELQRQLLLEDTE